MFDARLMKENLFHSNQLPRVDYDYVEITDFTIKNNKVKVIFKHPSGVYYKVIYHIEKRAGSEERYICLKNVKEVKNDKFS